MAGRADSIPVFDHVSAATIATSEADKAPQSAATLPPPGAGELLDSSSAKSRTVMAMSPFGRPAKRYSITLRLGSNAANSESPRDSTAVCTRSFSGTPVVFPCLAR